MLITQEMMNEAARTNGRPMDRRGQYANANSLPGPIPSIGTVFYSPFFF